jgi:hypothetical protein
MLSDNQPYKLRPCHLSGLLYVLLFATCIVTIFEEPAHAVQVVAGRYDGNGLDNRFLGGLGFRPDALIIKGENAQEAVIRTTTMSGDASKLVSEATALVANRVQSLDADGFTVGSDLDVNSSTAAYHWVAFRDDGLGDFKVGSYTGNGTDNRSITGVGFPPDYVIVMSSAANKTLHRSSATAADESLFFSADAAVANAIQRLQVDGFEVGTSGAVNTTGVVYHYIAWRARRMAVGSYIGDAIDNRSITGIGGQPVYVIVKIKNTTAQGYHRTATVIGDLTLRFNDTTVSNGIQAFEPDGFQIGTGGGVNTKGSAYFWIAFTPNDLPTPTIASLSPNVGPSGTSVTVSGWSFGASPGSLTLNGVSVTPTSWNNTSITFTVPDGATSGAVQVTAGGRTSRGVGFIVSAPFAGVSYFYDSLNRLKAVVDQAGEAGVYNYDIVGNLLSIERKSPPQVGVFGFRPKSGPGGTSVVVSGVNFSPSPSGNVVKLGTVDAHVSAASPNEIVAILPAGTACATISVTTSSSSATSEEQFCP